MTTRNFQHKFQVLTNICVGGFGFLVCSLGVSGSGVDLGHKGK